MSYGRYITGGIISGIRKVGSIILNEKKSSTYKIHPCVECPNLIKGGDKKKRCAFHEDKRRTNLTIENNRRRYKNSFYRKNKQRKVREAINKKLLDPLFREYYNELIKQSVIMKKLY